MLTITVGGTEVFDDSTQEFRTQDGVEIHLEHSLVSLSKWESRFEKPFLGNQAKTPEELLAYIECMVVGKIPGGNFLHQLSEANMEAINAYINAKMSATWFSDAPNAPETRREVITAELIYYWMTVFNIPLEWENRHLNQLFTLIRICNAKQEKPKKMSRNEAAQRRRELNAQRKAQMGTKG